MSREAHVRICGGRRVRFPPATRRRLRPLGVAALEDKVLQRAVVEVLNAVYEQDFLGFSYGFRPGRSQHDALDALATGITRRKVNFVLDADISDFFTGLDQSWLVKFLEHRIADKRVLRLIQKWLRAGVIEDGEWSSTETGTAQGASVSPLLSNVFLHYVFECATNVKRGDAVGSRLSMQCSTEDGGLMALRDRPMGDDAKPPHAALVSDRRGERCGHGARDASGGGHGDDRC